MAAPMEMFFEQQARKDSHRMIADMVDECFSACIYNFRTRKIDPKEKLCLYQCTDKYFRHAAKANRVMTEQTLLMREATTPAPE